eukprot:CFRG7253T1
MKTKTTREATETLTINSTVTLSNGLEMPLFGLGTSHQGGFNPDALQCALDDCGYTMIDTARRYGCEKQIGTVLSKSKVPRDQIWITTKLWPGDYDRVYDACLESMVDLGVEYLDLYLMHWPGVGGTHAQDEQRLRVWRDMEYLYEEGLVRAIGVSNFLVSHLSALVPMCNVRPMVNQVEFNVFQQPNDVLRYCLSEGIHVQGFCPLAKAQVLNHPMITEIGMQSGKSPAQTLKCSHWMVLDATCA